MESTVRNALERQNPWWFGKSTESGIPRLAYHPAVMRYVNTKEIFLLLGARRTGKSTLLYQIISELKTDPESILFINFDEPLFQSRAKDPEFLQNLIDEYMIEHTHIKKFYVFIDEIQNYQYWVQTLKVMNDTVSNIKFILTGSTSTLIESSISTRLSGRYFSYIAYPLSFQEFLSFKNETNVRLLEKAKHYRDYLKYGAFPRVVLEKDTSLKVEILKNYFQTIYLKDIIYPYRIRNNKDVFDLLYFVISNTGKPLSYTNIAKTLGMATDTVKEYLDYAEQAYLLYSITKYDPSVRKQLANPKKLYCLDTGLINSVSFQFSENKGRLLENLVFMILRRMYPAVYYHKNDNECDFVIKEGLKIKHAIQVTLSLKNAIVRKREIKGLMDAMDEYRLHEGTIITEAEKESIKIDNTTIHVKPIYEFLESVK